MRVVRSSSVGLLANVGSTAIVFLAVDVQFLPNSEKRRATYNRQFVPECSVTVSVGENALGSVSGVLVENSAAFRENINAARVVYTLVEVANCKLVIVRAGGIIIRRR